MDNKIFKLYPNGLEQVEQYDGSWRALRKSAGDSAVGLGLQWEHVATYARINKEDSFAKCFRRNPFLHTLPILVAISNVMFDFDNYRAVQIRLPQYGFPIPGRDPFDQATVRKEYPGTASPQKDLCKINDFEEIQFERTYGVCRAWTGPRDKPGSTSFIIKFAISGSDERHEALRQEAAIYHERLPSLQGKDVPIFHGYFEGEKLNSKDKKVSCIFLEDCGEPVYGSLVDLPLSARAQIFKEVGRIHLCGMTLDDFHEGNVVRKENSYRIIDFQHVEIRSEHSCLWKDDRVYEGKPVPTFRDIGCRTMHNIGLELDLWKSRLSVEVMGSNCPKNEYPTQEAIDILCQGVVLHHFDDEFKLQSWLKEYKQVEDRLTPEQYMEQHKRPTFTGGYFGPRKV